jgi:hypothetical protein
VIDVIERAPTPIGWQPERTYTGNPPRSRELDRFDREPSRNPYPRNMPSLGGEAKVDRHVGLVHHYSKRVFEETLLIEGGDRGLPEVLRKPEPVRRAERREAVLRRKAILEELGTGVVFLSEEDERILAEAEDDNEEEAFA